MQTFASRTSYCSVERTDKEWDDGAELTVVEVVKVVLVVLCHPSQQRPGSIKCESPTVVVLVVVVLVVVSNSC